VRDYLTPTFGELTSLYLYLASDVSCDCWTVEPWPTRAGSLCSVQRCKAQHASPPSRGRRRLSLAWTARVIVPLLPSLAWRSALSLPLERWRVASSSLKWDPLVTIVETVDGATRLHVRPLTCAILVRLLLSGTRAKVMVDRMRGTLAFPRTTPVRSRSPI